MSDISGALTAIDDGMTRARDAMNEVATQLERIAAADLGRQSDAARNLANSTRDVAARLAALAQELEAQGFGGGEGGADGTGGGTTQQKTNRVS